MVKAKIAIIGKGNIGWAIKQLLKDDYEIKHGDITEGLDARDIDQVREFLKGTDAVISAGPFAINQNILKNLLEMSKNVQKSGLSDGRRSWQIFALVPCSRQGPWIFCFLGCFPF